MFSVSKLILATSILLAGIARKTMKKIEISAASRRVILTGASGFIGSSLRRRFEESSKEVLQLVRRVPSESKNEVAWDPYAMHPFDPASLSRLEGSVAAVHLSGANVSAHRWTRSYKKTIFESRTRTTDALARILAGLKTKPAVLVSASAVGIYGDRGSETLDETSSLGDSFLAEVCRAWEKASQPAADAGIRVVHLRFGVVLSTEGGALAPMLPVFRLGLGGRLGSGQQWMSWVALADVIRAIEFVLDRKEFSGAVNLVAPMPVTNSEFTRTLGQTLNRPTLLPVPAFGLRIAFGDLADNALLASQRAIPMRLQTAGFSFQHCDLGGALRSLLPRTAN
jgi:uncharacterized protein